MIERLGRVIEEAPGRPGPLDIAEAMQATTREIAFDPSSWTPERKRRVADLFDQLAPTWSSRANELRVDPLSDAFDRGRVDGGLVLEVGSGSGNFTPWLADRCERLVAVDLSLEMLRHAPARAAPRVCADASALPFAVADVIVLVNCFLFPVEVDRVLDPGGCVVWVSTIGDRTPIYMAADEVMSALPGPWTALASEAGWGSWAVVRRG